MRMTSLMVMVASLTIASANAWAQNGQQAFNHGNDNGNGRDHVIHLSAKLEPSHEVPSVSSPAQGRFSAEIDLDAEEMTYTLTFSGLQAPVTQSHIHFAQPNVNGGIVVWFCGTATNPGPAGTQTCPQSGTITGTIHASDIQTVTTQGIATGEFDELVAAIRSGLTYTNVHSQQSPGGEIRGQVHVNDRH
jgi:CHRD domain